MRTGYNHGRNKISSERLMQTDLHRFIECESERTPYELAVEFGLSIREVRELKKRLERN